MSFVKTEILSMCCCFCVELVHVYVQLLSVHRYSVDTFSYSCTCTSGLLSSDGKQNTADEPVLGR